MRPFVVFGLPRSRTAWLSRFLTYGDWVCGHAVRERGSPNTTNGRMTPPLSLVGAGLPALQSPALAARNRTARTSRPSGLSLSMT